MKKQKKSLFKLLAVYFLTISLFGCKTKSDIVNEYDSYLFTYFVGNGPGEESIHYALSNDGFNYYALNNNEPIINSKEISTSGGVRDPHILRGQDGKTFYMVVTDLYVPKDGWSNYAMILMKSTDLINWSSTKINVPNTFPKEFGKVHRVWAPQTIYDSQSKKYMVYWSMKTGDEPDKIYYAYANKDFTALETTPKQLFYSPTNSACIDGDIIYNNGKYHLFFKNEDENKKGIMKAVSDKLTEGYVQVDGYMDQTDEAVEGSGIFKIIDSDTYILMYDMYMKGKYQFTKSTDLLNFSVVDDEISMNFHPRHGTVIPITKKETEALIKKWGTINKNVFLSFNSEEIKKNNVIIDDENKTIYIPAKQGTDITNFNPNFKLFSGVTSSPTTPQNFSKESVNYTFTIKNKETKTYQVTVNIDHNPVLDGYYADPEIIFSNKTKKYYLYPTTDGFTNWSGTYFKTFSSTDLVNWNDEGTILDLKKDVKWANRNAWAPTITEKKVNETYKYFYYFTAAQKIGVAVSDNPTGPFVDSGKPLISKKPKGVIGGQEIDPDVFTDPVTNKSYLYWGNGYLACAELNDDMISIKENTIKVMTPDATFREGTEVFYRNGKYYFLWSENDTRSPNYQVRYATSSSPTGKLTIPKNNLILSKNPELGIYGTGHNSVIQILNSDEWYIVYHRFNRPNGINKGDSAGYHREVCIDVLEFNIDNSIKPVKPTLKGIKTEISN
ncbi:family 43 glycosylhydrolase [Lutibacter sp. B1]|uniref:family 43 glycosylhydrolase n=1 Tax=Lutibacter sp. B1 TaxID=2725996 RepID=UPI0014573864|nr:family 43 glycosylhydrolase [Lutibacter sp. B1]NLP56869.1 family 43 glycosylhydrolase [Lutibacter sp. B1]